MGRFKSHGAYKFVLEFSSTVRVRIWTNDIHLVATDAYNDVTKSSMCHDHPCASTKDLVSMTVTEKVVHRLEVVEVHVNDRKKMPTSYGTHHLYA